MARAAIRLPNSGQLSYSDVLFHCIGDRCYTVTTLPTQPAADSNDACWSSLLGGNAIARDYPIPERRDEVGLELPFSLMMELVGEVLPKMYDKGIYIYF